MTWVAWRQQRLQILTSLALALVVAAVMVAVRFAAADALAALGLAGCWTSPDGCVGAGMDEFIASYAAYLTLYPLVGLALPVLLGMFAGAPMFAREVERGTHVFGLTQSVGRTRWWVTKAAVGGGPVVLAMTGLGLLNTWAIAPLRPVLTNRLTTPRFETEGLVVGAYTLLAVCVGIALGVWLRNTVAAMSLTLAVSVAVMAGLASGVRADRYVPPILATESINNRAAADSPVPADAWWLRTGYLDQHGREIEPPTVCVAAGMLSEPRNGATVDDRLSWRAQCLREHGVTSRFVWYQPTSRFWPFQLIESTVVSVLAVLLLGLAALGIRHRLT